MKRYIRSAIASIHDESDDTKRGLAKSDYTSTRDLAALAEDSDRFVRRDVAENPNLPMEARKRLIEEDHDLATHSAIYYGDLSPEYLDELARRSDGTRYAQAVAQHRNTSPETLDWIADNYDESYVLSGVAGNKNTAPETLAKLATSRDYHLRQHVAYNPHTPIEVLKKLAKDRSSVQVRSVANFTLGRLGEV